jgi:hypothetical protein
MNHWDHCKSVLETQICTPFLSQHDLETAWNQVKGRRYVNCGHGVPCSIKCDLKEILIKAYFFSTYDISDTRCTHMYTRNSTKCPTNDKSVLHKLVLWKLILYSMSVMLRQSSKLSKLPPLSFSFFQVCSIMVSKSSIIIYVRSFMSM